MSTPASLRPAAPWGVSAGALLATMVAAGSLRTLVQGEVWWWASLLVGGLAVAASAGVRAVPRIRALAPLAGTLVAVLTALLIWVPGTLTWIVIPTDRTVGAIGALIRAAVRQIYLDSPPATATAGLQLMIALGVGILAVLVDALAAELRMPWLAGLPLLLLAIVPSRSVGLGDDLPGVTATAVAFLLLVWLDRRRDQSRPPLGSAAALAGTAVVGALLVQSFLPALVNPTPASAGPLRPVFAPGADPLVRLGDTLRRGADVTVLTYRTTASAPVYLRVVTIDDLTGDEWAPTTSESGDPASRQVQTFPDPPGLGPLVDREEISTVVSDAYQQRSWTPVPYPATSVEGLIGAWAWEPEALTVQAVGRTRSVPEYTVHSLQVEPTIEQLRGAPPSGPGLERYLALPDTTPEVIGQRARDVTAGAGTAYDQAMALQDYLRSREFTYDESTPQRADGDGDSMDVVAAFLDAKRGYCVHFAAAMTVMARELGIPARIAVGYQPGERRINEPGIFEVTSHDLHAWPELYFEGVGWTRFEPTPGRGDVPRFRTGADQNSNAPSSAPTPTPSAGTRSDRNEQDVAASSSGSGGGPPAGGVALAGGIVVVLAAPGVTRALLRRRRLAKLRSRRAGPAWDEVQDTAIDLGILDSAVATPRALTERVEDLLGSSQAERDQLTALLGAVERERFARPGTVGEPAREETVRHLLHRMRASRPRLARLRATLAPRSLFLRLTALTRPGGAALTAAPAQGPSKPAPGSVN